MPNRNPLTAQEYAEIVAAGQRSAALDPKIKQQMMAAEYLRKGNRPEGRMAGNVYVAPHWLETAGGLAREYAANKRDNQVQQAIQQQQMEKQAQQALMLKAILGRTQQAAPMEPEGQGLRPGAQGGPFGME